MALFLQELHPHECLREAHFDLRQEELTDEASQLR
jgi:hypothetical protein